MKFVNLLKSAHLGYFYAQPLGEQEKELGIYKKNRLHFDNLVAEAQTDPNLRKEIFEELEWLACHFPENPPEGSHANVLVFRLAIKLATVWDAPFLIKMLFCPAVLNHRDNSFISILLEGIRQKGYAEDADALLVFRQELGNPQRYYYLEGKGDDELIPMPGMVWLREQVMEVIRICRNRGLRESEVTRIEAGAAA